MNDLDQLFAFEWDAVKQAPSWHLSTSNRVRACLQDDDSHGERLDSVRSNAYKLPAAGRASDLGLSDLPSSRRHSNSSTADYEPSAVDSSARINAFRMRDPTGYPMQTGGVSQAISGRSPTILEVVNARAER